MIRPLYNWVMKLAAGRHAPKALAAVSFAESSFFPIPPDVMLAPMILARPEKAYRYATICTIASVLGGCLGYAIGYFLEPVGLWVLSLIGHADGLDKFKELYGQYGLWVILVKGLTPFPYKLVTIASGLAQFNFAVFVAASVVTRGARFFLAAWVLKRFGPQILEVVERRLYTVAAVVLALIVGGVLLVRLL
ncbi:YqaA family protein [Caulobacter sp. 17J65-9]|uniref:VTT domain-containing protein n=1 Tax=Caulobacter sp. 17J65-9 TaxID=2709382 RepID=UPI0013C9EBD1|nr:DedA family protein [Caulobacter sp. 17J65-9]